ncbi:hypothetical protein [Scytonema sp. HK-05]|nr:hypothetical protein [Scytonema sp. HK-05]
MNFNPWRSLKGMLLILEFPKRVDQLAAYLPSKTCWLVLVYTVAKSR